MNGLQNSESQSTAVDVLDYAIPREKTKAPRHKIGKICGIISIAWVIAAIAAFITSNVMVGGNEIAFRIFSVLLFGSPLLFVNSFVSFRCLPSQSKMRGFVLLIGYFACFASLILAVITFMYVVEYRS